MSERRELAADKTDSLVERNPARDAALAEFNALRAEITNRMTTTSALVGVALTALSVIVGLVVKEGGDRRLLLAVPPLAVTVNFLWAVENRQVGYIGRYIRTSLWPYLAQGDDGLPSWEDDCANRRGGGNIVRSVFTDYTMTLVLAGAAIWSLIILGDHVRVGKVDKLSRLVLFDWVLALVARWSLSL